MTAKETIFMTGFPGFIAGRLLERLASADTRFYLLVQPHLMARAASEISAAAERARVPEENFFLIEGDITRSGLGMTDADLQAVRADVTSVFHLAAAYDLAVPRDVAYGVNLDGTRNVNDVVSSIDALNRYNYVSTCYVAGRRTGTILETELEHDAAFRNFYEETKYLAEVEVENLKGKVPVTIFRPSVVVGDSRTGETAKYDGIYYLIQYLRKWPAVLRLINVGNSDVRLNLVPVDFVVDGMAALSRDPEAENRTVALADPDPPATRELFDLIAAAMTGRRSLFSPPPGLVLRSLMTRISPSLSGLPHSAVPYFFLEQRYDTTIADPLLAKHGILCPPFASYVRNLLRFVDEHPVLPG
jgi:nucleoside-diphosphate-sugar epimerase